MFSFLFFDALKCYFCIKRITMQKNKSKKSKLLKITGSKYFIASVLFLAWIIFFDENSVVTHQENKKRLQELVRQKKYYKEKIASDEQKLEDLNAGKKELEKFAREQYYMSKPDEDVFIVVEEE